MWWILLRSNWKLVVIALAFVVSNAWSVNYGMNLVEAEQAAALSRQHKQNLKINAEVSDALSKKYAVLRKRHNDLIGLLSPGVVRVPDPAGGDNGATGGNGLPWQARGSLAALMLQADLQTAQLQACQQWIKENAER